MNKSILEAQHLTGRVFNRDAGTIERMKRTRTIPFVASTGDKDRHGSILNQDNWDLTGFNLNPVIGYQHQLHPDMCIKSTPDDVVGKGMNVRIDRDEETGKNRLLLDIWFEDEETNPLAEKVFRKLLNGTLNAVSVGFYPILEGDQESRKGNPAIGEDPTADYMFGQELLEVSVVNIPSNKYALQKAIGDTVANALHFCRQQLNKSLIDLEKMTVGEVVAQIQGQRKAENPAAKLSDSTTLTPEAAEKMAEDLANIQKIEDTEAEASRAAEDAAGEAERLALELELKRKKINLK